MCIRQTWIIALAVIIGSSLGVGGCAQNKSGEKSWATKDPVMAQATRFQGIPATDMTLSARMRHYGVTAVSVAVLHHGGIIETWEFGVTSSDSIVEVTPQTRFQAASLSKPVTAIAALRLVDTGAVSLNEPINDYLGGWELSGSSRGDEMPITLKSLLSHSAGISVKSYPGFERDSVWPTLDDILAGRENAYSSPVEAKGVRGQYAYSGGGFMVVQKLIETQSESSFESAMQRDLFGMLEMNRSTFLQLTTTGQIALGHDWRGRPIKGGWHEYPHSAAAGLWSTPTDLIRLLKSIAAAYNGSPDAVVTPAVARSLTNEVVSGTGLGFGVHGHGTDRLISHAGWTSGYRSHLQLYPERGDGVVVMCNGQAGNHLIAEILRTIALAYGWPPLSPTIEYKAVILDTNEIRSLVGIYTVSPAGFELTIEADDHGFRLKTPRGSSEFAIPISSDELVLSDTGEIVLIDTSGELPRLSLWGMTADKKTP